jgi:uncharacterized protein YjbI with pentapeptide repeats
MITTEILDDQFAREAHLEGPHLADVVFVGAQFNGAHLEGVHLNGRNLTRTYLREAHLEGAQLNGARLEEAYLEEAHLEGAYLQHAVAPCVHLKKTHLEGAHLEGLVAPNAYAYWSYLNDAHLERAELEGAFFNGADLRGAHLELADLRRVSFEPVSNDSGSRSRKQKTNLSGAHLNGAHLERADLRGVDLTGADLRGAHLDRAKFKGANLTGAFLTGVIDANFTGAIGVDYNNIGPPVIIAPPVINPNAPPVINPIAPPVIAPKGIAYQVHNEFKVLNKVKFMEIIRANITPDRIEGELLEKLITYSETNLPAQTLALGRINDTINRCSGKNGNNVQDVITFVLSQPALFIERYTEWFVDECLKAYTSVSHQNTESCVKGQYERVFMSLKAVLGITCNETPDCPPVYRELLACFTPDYDKLFRDWFEMGQLSDAETNYENKPPEEKEAYINSKKAIFKT